MLGLGNADDGGGSLGDGPGHRNLGGGNAVARLVDEAGVALRYTQLELIDLAFPLRRVKPGTKRFWRGSVNTPRKIRIAKAPGRVENQLAQVLFPVSILKK